MAQKPFKIEKHTGVDRSFDVTGPDGLRLTVDFGDVNTRTVNHHIRKMVAILNEQWEGLDCDSFGILFLAKNNQMTVD